LQRTEGWKNDLKSGNPTELNSDATPEVVNPIGRAEIDSFEKASDNCWFFCA